eukprot:CAMPEP_0195280820 /NCGR_PEP_ID=MMETSP0707-20130614/362_1 /TAXON_ID=33640 /ORGANISM="Asterionellopsis glacialis, Strain CCMP134" /LENGTH=261 /DNA_ID=CAMNT_0040339631 /DNA_START=67 /DNA_END=852 /DNA_ORIENTATION=-
MNNHHEQQERNQLYDNSSTRNIIPSSLISPVPPPMLLDDDFQVNQTRPTVPANMVITGANFPFVLVPPQSGNNDSALSQQSQYRHQEAWHLQPRHCREYNHAFENIDALDRNLIDDYDFVDQPHEQAARNEDHHQIQPNANDYPPSVPILSRELHTYAIRDRHHQQEHHQYVPSLKPRINFNNLLEQQQRVDYSSFSTPRNTTSTALTHDTYMYECCRSNDNNESVAMSEEENANITTEKFDYCSSSLSEISSRDVYTTPS